MAIVIIAVILLIWSGRSALHPASTEFLTERFWIDRVTDDPREMVDALFLADDSDVGLTAKTSRFRLSIDFVEWNLDGERLSIHVLQEDRRAAYQVKTWRCQPGEAPSEELEYCMSLEGPNGTKRYFASDREDARLRAILAAKR